jgi:hypothetical protein
LIVSQSRNPDPSASLGTGSGRLRLWFRSIEADQICSYVELNITAAHLTIKFGNLFRARSLLAEVESAV